MKKERLWVKIKRKVGIPGISIGPIISRLYGKQKGVQLSEPLFEKDIFMIT